MSLIQLNNALRTIPDFPKPGIAFKDITPVLKTPSLYQEVIQLFHNRFKNEGIDVVIGIESRGFIFAGPLALQLNCGLALARKQGKLPAATISEEYSLEYGQNTLELHRDSVQAGDRVLVIDDLLATGGTARAVGRLVQKLNGVIVAFGFFVRLIELQGDRLLQPESVFSILDC